MKLGLGPLLTLNSNASYTVLCLCVLSDICEAPLPVGCKPDIVRGWGGGVCEHLHCSPRYSLRAVESVL